MHVIRWACDDIVVHHSQYGCFARPADDPAGWVARYIGNPAPGDSTSLNCDVARQLVAPISQIMDAFHLFVQRADQVG